MIDANKTINKYIMKTIFKSSEFLSLNLLDFIKGLGVAIGSAVLSSYLGGNGVPVKTVAISTALVYLTKNFFSGYVKTEPINIPQKPETALNGGGITTATQQL